VIFASQPNILSETEHIPRALSQVSQLASISKISYLHIQMHNKTAYIISFLNSLTIRKCLNILKVYFSYYSSRLTGKISHRGMPFSLAVEPTNLCNLKCPQCPSGMDLLSRKKGNIGTELYEKIMDELSPYLMHLTLYFQGEPFLNPDLTKLISIAKNKKIITAISTNGHFLTEDNCEKIITAGLDRIIISMDGLDQKTYEKYRVNGDFQKVVDGIKTLVDKRKKLKKSNPFIELQFLVFNHNEHQIIDFRKFAKYYGADSAKIKTAQIYNPDSNSEMIPSSDKYSRYKKDNQGKYQIKSSLKNHCFRMWSSAVVLHDGRVSPCCFDKDATFVLGDLNDSTFGKIFKSDEYNKFRNSVFSERKNIEMCCNCTEGLKTR